MRARAEGSAQHSGARARGREIVVKYWIVKFIGPGDLSGEISAPAPRDNEYLVRLIYKSGREDGEGFMGGCAHGYAGLRKAARSSWVRVTGAIEDEREIDFDGGD